ncbi:MAG: M67 family metallopeptidase [Bacteroidia bacterium]
MIQFEKEAIETMINHLENSFPNEGCGFIYGKNNEGQKLVNQAVPVINSKSGDQRRRFEISPLDYMKAERFALEQGLELLGVYHSHPQHPAVPSEHDLKQAVPVFSYPILSIQNGKFDHIRSWYLDDSGSFSEEELSVNQVVQLA